jgi:uncharacterized membrane protein
MAVSSAHVLHSATWGPALVAAVILAALMHATWNAIAHAVDDRLIGFALIGLVYAVLGAAIVVATGFPSAEAWAYIVASAVVHVAYNLFLLAAYQWGEFSQTYPLARGLAPVLVVAIATYTVTRRAARSRCPWQRSG